jgi:alpha-N-arabinofuranosidase
MPQKGEDAAYSLSERPGYLRLFARSADMRGKDHPGFAGRRIQHKAWFFSASLEFLPEQDNERAGLILIQSEDYQYRFEIGRVKNQNDTRDNAGNFFLSVIRAAGKEDEVILELPCPELADAENSIQYKNADASGGVKKSIVLAVKSEDLEVSFYYGKNQYELKKIPVAADGSILSTEYSGGFVGVLVGIFATAGGKESNNYADVEWAEYKGLN